MPKNNCVSKADCYERHKRDADLRHDLISPVNKRLLLVESSLAKLHEGHQNLGDAISDVRTLSQRNTAIIEGHMKEESIILGHIKESLSEMAQTGKDEREAAKKRHEALEKKIDDVRSGSVSKWILVLLITILGSILAYLSVRIEGAFSGVINNAQSIAVIQEKVLNLATKFQ